MEYVCLVCEQMICMVYAADAAEFVHQSARTTSDQKPLCDLVEASFTATSGTLISETSADKPNEMSDSAQAARCCKCDGIYHVPCLLKQGNVLDQGDSTFTCVRCHSKTQKLVHEKVGSLDDDLLPVLVPAVAFPYVKQAQMPENHIKCENSLENFDQIMIDNGNKGWTVSSSTVEVCTTCRQVQIAAEDQETCLKCHNAQLHHRCVARFEAKDDEVSVRKIINDGISKKRRCTSLKTASKWCARCSLANNEPIIDGSIETRTLALLVNDNNVPKKYNECCTCKQKFCLQEFCDGEDTDVSLQEILAIAPLNDTHETQWSCIHCSSATTSPALVTLLVCDECEREYDMASVYPSMASVPPGDWFCNDCALNRGNIKSNVTYESVTLLICDLCDCEYDMKALDPPLNEVPSGDWFCPACISATQGTSQKGCNENIEAGGQSKYKAQNTVPTTLKHEVIVTVLLCDGCDHEFDPLSLDPPLLVIPEGEWFCPACTDARASDGVQKCAGCDTIFQGGGSTVDRLHRPSGIVDGVLLCEACSNLQVGYSRRRLVPTAPQSLTATKSRKRSRVTGAKVDLKAIKHFKTENIASDNSSAFHQSSQSTSTKVSDENSDLCVRIPKPLTFVPSSASARYELDSKQSSGWSYINPSVIIADPDDQLTGSNIDDVEESGILIVCDICFGEFKMLDVLGTDEASAIPARPWVCKPCIRALKRSRKKRPRFSKQMVLEMQVYGRLLRASAAKVMDIDASIRLGYPPNSHEERRRMYELVGKSVGVFLQWDKHWVMGRILAFQSTHSSMHHTIRFDDGVIASLPLYALPLVIGTRTMVYVKAPVQQNRWWPAQILHINAYAKKLLTPTQEDEITARGHFQFVRIFAASENVACWVPNHLCRSMKRFVPPLDDLTTSTTKEVESTKLSRSIERAKHELQAETDQLNRAFKALLLGFRRILATSAHMEPAKGIKRPSSRHLNVIDRCTQVAHVLVDKTIVITSSGSFNERLLAGNYIVTKFDIDSKKHHIADFNDTIANSDILVDLLQGTDGVEYYLKDGASFGELATLLLLDGSGVSGGIPGEFQSKKMLEKAIIDETGIHCLNTDSAAAGTHEGDGLCSHCLLNAEDCQDREDTQDIDNRNKKEDLVICVKCDRRFHSTCCDPPHAPLSLVSPDDGTVLVSDLRIPFVCSECTVCAGCRDEGCPVVEFEWKPRWSQWRLPLKPASLCTKCIPYYKANRFCSVCNFVLDDDTLAVQVDLLNCSMCHHWVHAACEPDANPAFHAFSSTSEFALDVVTDVESASREADSESVSSFRTPVGSRSPSEERSVALGNSYGLNKEDGAVKTAKQMEEEFARSLSFQADYDSKVLHHYECLTCRKVRMLHILHRLGSEDKLDLFKEPVTETIAPTYFEIIKSPMDLSTMRQKILDGAYTNVNFRSFRDDFELMCLNAVTFNTKERDFLIWREAWRFYGQGQRILRQTAPKARMKQRGGRHYDALKVAAKRQLPNNSALAGKPQSGDALDNIGEAGEDEDLNEDEDGDGDDGSDTGSDRVNGVQEGSIILSEVGSEAPILKNTVAKRKGSISTESTQRDEDKTSGSAGVDSNSNSALALTPDRRSVMTNEACEFQTKLRMATLRSLISRFLIVQTRTSAHTYSWLDLCTVCGSAGLSTEYIFCVDCGEGFHWFCIPGMNADRLHDNDHFRAYWRCANCKMCEICGQPGTVFGANSNSKRPPATAGNVDDPASSLQTSGGDNDQTLALSNAESLLVCKHCDRGYHGSCLRPAIKMSCNSKRENETAFIYCANCVTCTTCEDTSRDRLKSQHLGDSNEDDLSVLERMYSYERSKCLHCYNQNARDIQAQKERTRLLTEVWTTAAFDKKKDAERCPLCRRKWAADVEELMQCDACERWVHPPCDASLKANPQRYETLVNDPNAVYVCVACRPQNRHHVLEKIADGEGWRCQVLIAEIQRKRSQCDSSWKETHRQLAQVERWIRLADNTAVYLYVLRLGEECLRNFAYRSLNFQSDWYRFTKQQELDESHLVVPDWLLRKANRYMRFKRYMRGPRVAMRRQARKTASFYSKQAVGLNSRKDASAICMIVSEAASCAALLACIHLLYGWRPLPEVVIHLLSSDEDAVTGTANRKLDEMLLQRLRSGEILDGQVAQPRLELEAEIATIKDQYDRRVSKRHLVHAPTSEQNVFGFGTCSSNAEVKDQSQDEVLAANVKTSKVVASTAVETNSNDYKHVTPAMIARSSSNRVDMTTVAPLHGWPTSETAAPFDDSRFCALCFMVGDNSACGRLLYTELETWVHVNCALWSMEVNEDGAGVLHRCSKAKHRSRLIRCDACGLMGATIGCAIARCTRHYHFPCAVDAGVAFLMTGETCCPLVLHLDMMAKRVGEKPMKNNELVQVKPADEAATMSAAIMNADSPTDDGGMSNAAVKSNDSSELDDMSSADETGCKVSASCEATITPMPTMPIDSIITAESDLKSQDEGAPINQENKTTEISGDEVMSVVQSECELPVVNPRPEPRRSLFSDPPLLAVSDLKKKKRAELKRGIKPRPMCYRVGALTVHSLGHIFVGNASFHTRTALYPLGYRSTRIFWSTQSLATRCLYECVVSSTEIEERRARRQNRVENGVADDDWKTNDFEQERRRPRAVFKIIASDAQDRPIIASTPEDALIELRSRIVSLYEEQRGFGTQSVGCPGTLETERNPFLKRSSWFSFALSGDYFFGFGLPEILHKIEELPYAATTAVSRRAVLRRIRQQQQRQGQSPLATCAAASWGYGSRKRSHDRMEQSATSGVHTMASLEVIDDKEEPYEFIYVLPSPEAFQTAERILEQLARAEQRAWQSSGCARTDGFEGNRLFGAFKKAKIMPRRQALSKEVTVEAVSGATSGVAMDIEHLPITMQYRELRRRPFDERMFVRKSTIHGYGLFMKEAVSEGQMIVEYQGQIIGQSVADERERRYEEQGVGSCYMFRLDDQTIIDATRCGNLARFINHSCDPKAFARVVVVEGGEKKIVIFAKRAIAAGDEVTYDYKFPIEDEAIRCDCNASNCIGRMN